jgi:hypothetical protein
VSLWGFIANVHKGMNKRRAFAALGLGFCASAPYRLWMRFVLAGATIRSTLLALGVPPPVDSPDPTRQTIAHILATFPQHSCPVADFQFQLQKAFL